MRPWLALVTVTLGTGLAEQDAWAVPTSKLSYVRAGGTERSCPNEAALRRAVAERVGYDPFFPWAERTVVAQIDRAPKGGFAGAIRIIDAEGHLLGERNLDTANDCSELVQNAALAISVAIDDLDAARPHAPTGPAAPGPPNESIEPNEPIEPVELAPELDARPKSLALPPRSKVERTVEVRASLGAASSLGNAPSPAFGVTVGLALRRAWAQVGLEARADLPAGDSVTSGGRVVSSLLLGSLVPCVVLPSSIAPYACGIGALGRYEGRSENVAAPASASAAYVALGGRVGLEITLVRWLAIYAQLDVLATLTRHRLELGGSQVFAVSASSAVLGGGLAAQF